MITRRVCLVVAAVAVLPLTMAFSRGGWAVFTVEKLPEYLPAGEPVELSFSVRQHGMTLTHGMDMGVILSAPGKEDKAMSLRGTDKTGYYMASIVAPEPGDWNVAIQYGGGYMRLQLLPLTAVAAGSPPPEPLPANERGRRLFVAKGCNMCHYNSATGVGRRSETGDPAASMAMASDLSGRKFPAKYLSMILADPAAMPAYATSFPQMPKLNLSEGEISDIVAFFETNW